MAQNTISPSERSARFQIATRQNYQMLPEQRVTSGASNMRFDMPKVRFLSKILIDFEASIKIKHATKTDVPADEFTPYKLIRNLSLDVNNGWKPYTIGGRQLALLNAIRLNPSIVFPQSTNPDGYCYMPMLTASPDGDLHSIKFTVELPVTVNDRDTMGLILLQAQSLLCTLSIDFANGNDLLDNAEGYTVDIEEIIARPMWESFSVPATQDAYPDISIVKMVRSRSEIFASSGINNIKIPTGTVYRKLAFYITDNNGNPLELSDYNGTLDIVFNQTDTNYAIDPRNLRHLNELQLGYSLPKGCFVFDFSNNGFPNYGGSRDYVDTSNLTEMSLKFHAKKAGICHIVMEELSVLRNQQ